MTLIRESEEFQEKSEEVLLEWGKILYHHLEKYFGKLNVDHYRQNYDAKQELGYILNSMTNKTASVMEGMYISEMHRETQQATANMLNAALAVCKLHEEDNK